MKEDRKIRVRRAGEEIEALMSNNQVRELWSKTQRWYQEAKGHQVPPDPTGRPLHAPSSGGRNNSNLSTTGKYRGWKPRGRGDIGGGKENPVGKGGRTIGDEGGTP